MSFDYFYGQQSDLFTFYRVPKVLFTNERFWNISADAKMLYGILLDRMSLSAKNGWIDKKGRVYIIFTIDEAKMALNCAEQKAIKLLSELEKKAGLIERKRQGLGKPNLIYVKNFISAVDSQLLNCENHNSGTMEITTQELPKSQCNNTDINAETTAKLAEVLKVSPAVFSPTICASREDLLQSMYWLFLMKGGGDIYDCETEYARSRMEQKLGVITVEEFLEKILVN